MAVNQTIMELNDAQLDEVIKLLYPLDNQLDKRVNYAMKTLSMAKNEGFPFGITIEEE